MKLLVKWAITFALSLLIILIWVKWDLDPSILYVIRFLGFIAFFVLTVYLFSLVFREAFKQNKVLDKTMAETLSVALGSESSPLFAEIYANILRFDKSTYNSPCFLGLTNTKLLMVIMDPMLTPSQIYSFPLTDISSCKMKKSFIPNQYILDLHFDKLYIKYRIYCKVNNLKNQNSNALYFLDELCRYSGQPDK